MGDEVGGCGNDVGNSRAGTWEGQVSPYRAPSCTARNLSEGAPTDFGRDTCPRVAQASDRFGRYLSDAGGLPILILAVDLRAHDRTAIG